MDPSVEFCPNFIQYSVHDDLRGHVLHLVLRDPIARTDIVEEPAYPEEEGALNDQGHRAWPDGTFDIDVVEVHDLAQLPIVDHLEFGIFLPDLVHPRLLCWIRMSVIRVAQLLLAEIPRFYEGLLDLIVVFPAFKPCAVKFISLLMLSL